MLHHRLTDYYDHLARTHTTSETRWSHNDLVIWFVIGARCEMDMGGFHSVFDQFLQSDDLDFLIDALRALDEPELADAFDRIRTVLHEVDFYGREVDCYELPPATLKKLKDEEAVIRRGDRLWELDDKLTKLLPLN